MNLPQAIFLFAAAAFGGALNAVAGGGSFIAFPALLFTGVRPIPANATNTLALWVGTAASGGAYRKRLNISARVMIPLLIASLIGGLLGAVLLIKTREETFEKLIPWLMLAATLLFAFGKYLTGRIAAGVSHESSNAAIVGACVVELFVAVYGGYFGGGMGIMILAMLAAIGMTDIHAMNALKVVLAAVTNGVAAVTFIATGVILWPQAAVMTIGAILGGYFGAHYAQKLPPAWIRGFVIVVGVGMSIYFFARAYL